MTQPPGRPRFKVEAWHLRPGQVWTTARTTRTILHITPLLFRVFYRDGQGVGREATCKAFLAFARRATLARVRAGDVAVEEGAAPSAAAPGDLAL